MKLVFILAGFRGHLVFSGATMTVLWKILLFVAVAAGVSPYEAAFGQTAPLPKGYQVPNWPSPRIPTPWDQLHFELQLGERNRVLDILDFDRSPLKWADKTLRISVGNQDQWTPGDYYAFLPNGYEARPHQAAAFLAMVKITFPKRFDFQTDKVVRSTNRPIYTCYREGPYIVLAKGDERRWYFESSATEGVWRLKQMELIKHPGQFTKLTYEGRLVTQIEYPNGEIVTIRNEKELPVQIDTPFGESIRITRDAGGFITDIVVVHVEKRRGKNLETVAARYKYERDAEGRIVSFVSPNGTQYTITYEASEKQENGQKHEIYLETIYRERDGLYRSRRDEIIGVQEWLVDYSRGRRGVKPQSNDPEKQYRIEAINHRWLVTSKKTDAASPPTTYEPDKLGNPVAELDPGKGITRRKYNELGLPFFIDSPEGRIEKSYNNFGEVTRLIHPDGQVTSYQYDSDARLTDVIAPDGQVTHYTYDDRGFPATASVGDHVYHFTFDDWGRLTAMSQDNGHYYDYFYDDLGRLTGQSLVKDSFFTEWCEFTYDGDRLVESQWQTKGGNSTRQRFRYDRQGVITAIDYSNRTQMRFLYNNLGWLVKKLNPQATSNLYQYRDDGKLAEERVYEGQELKSVNRMDD